MSDVQSESTAVALVDESQAVAVLTDAEKFDAFYDRVKAATDTLVADVTTDKGRKEIAAMAFRVVKTKTFIDGERKKLTEEARASIKLADDAGRKIRERLDSLRDEVRKPLTDWETAERDRVDRVNVTLARWQQMAVISLDDTAEDVAERLVEVRKASVDPVEFGDEAPFAEMILQQTITALETGFARVRKAEEDAAELARLVAADQQRREREEQERIEQEAEERRQEERRREDAEREREAQEAQERREAQERENAAAATRAAEEARQEAERAAEAERERIAAEHRAELKAAQDRADALERQRQADADKVAAEQAEREAQEREQAAERQRLENDREHRRKRAGEAKVALMTVITAAPKDATPEQLAVSIVRAIAAREIPNLIIDFSKADQ